MFVFAALDWVGWATGVQGLTRVFPAWPQMTPWTALWLAALGAAILLQSGSPSASRVWFGRGLAAVVGFFALVVLAEYATPRSFGVDQVWFGEAVRTLQSTWPGRPSPQTAISVVALSLAVGLATVDRQWAGTVRALSWITAMAAPGITALAYLFYAVNLLKVAASTGMALATALSLLLLGAAAVLVHPERGSVAWLLGRPDRQSLLRLVAIIAGFPIFVGASRLAFFTLGFDDLTALTFSTAVGTGVVGLLTLRLSQSERRQRESLEADRALLRASTDSLLDPQMLLEAVRDPATGRVVDFIYREANAAACKDMATTRDELIGRTVLELLPGFAESGPLAYYAQCLETGQPGALDDYSYDHEIQASSRRYDIRIAPAGKDFITLTFRDVTDRFQAARRIAASEAMLRASAESMLDPQVLMEAVRDPDGHVVDFRYLSVNQATCTYLGLNEGDLVGHTQRENSPNLEGSELHRRYIQCLQDGEPVVLDDYAFFNEILDDARRYDIRATRAGEDLLALTWRDVTERFAESERTYRLLAENAGDLVVHIRDGRFAWVSPSCTDVIGGSPDYWVGRDATEIVVPEEGELISDSTEAVESGGAVQLRHRVRAMDGTIHWVHVHAKPFYAPDGREDGITAAMRVIDDEVAAEQKVEEARRQQATADARYRRSMDTAAIGMCLTTPDGVFLEVNPAMCELFGYDMESLMQKNWQDLTAPESVGLADEELREMFGGLRDSYRVLGKLVHADGHRIWADVAVSCIRDQNGRVQNLSGQITDITAEVEAREKLALSDEQNRLLAERIGQQSRRMADELASAANYMATIMPRGLKGKVEVVSRYLPSRELGGDCFDYTWIDEDHLLVYLIDVSGHGLEPALLSVSVHNMIRSGTLGIETLLAPEVLLTELNSLFQMEQQGDHYFTVWCGVYEASTRMLRYSNAGSPPPFALNYSNGDAVSVEELSLASTPVGVFEESEFTVRTYPVPPGCQILIYSDGASEITLPNDHQLKPTDFKDLVARVASSPGWSLDGLINELHALSPSGAFEDDFSLIRLGFD